jgi:hypothetical protein
MCNHGGVLSYCCISQRNYISLAFQILFGLRSPDSRHYAYEKAVVLGFAFEWSYVLSPFCEEV